MSGGIYAALNWSRDAAQPRSPAQRFVRGKQQIDVIVADHLAPTKVPTIGGRIPFQIAGGTQALQRTVNCSMIVDDDGPVFISVPNALGALGLKGAAYREDPATKAGTSMTP